MDRLGIGLKSFERQLWQVLQKKKVYSLKYRSTSLWKFYKSIHKRKFNYTVQKWNHFCTRENDANTLMQIENNPLKGINEFRLLEADVHSVLKLGGKISVNFHSTWNSIRHLVAKLQNNEIKVSFGSKILFISLPIRHLTYAYTSYHVTSCLF